MTFRIRRSQHVLPSHLHHPPVVWYDVHRYHPTRLTSFTGFSIPTLGFGVYQNYTTKASVLEAFAAGYR